MTRTKETLLTHARCLAALLLLPLLSATATTSDLDKLDFMTGGWRYQTEGNVSEERWMDAAGSTKVASFDGSRTNDSSSSSW